MRNNFPYLGCALLIAMLVIEVLAVYFLANIFIPLPWWAALIIVVAVNMAFGVYKRIKNKKKA